MYPTCCGVKIKSQGAFILIFLIDSSIIFKIMTDRHDEKTIDVHIPGLPVKKLTNRHSWRGITVKDLTHCIDVLGLNQSQAAARLGCTRANVSAMLKRHNIIPGALKEFKEQRADVFANLQRHILDSISEEDLEKASLSQKTVAAGILYDKERLERGQSIQNVSYIDMSSKFNELHQKSIELAKQLGLRDANIVDVDGQMIDDTVYSDE